MGLTDAGAERLRPSLHRAGPVTARVAGADRARDWSPAGDAARRCRLKRAARRMGRPAARWRPKPLRAVRSARRNYNFSGDALTASGADRAAAGDRRARRAGAHRWRAERGRGALAAGRRRASVCRPGRSRRRGSAACCRNCSTPIARCSLMRACSRGSINELIDARAQALILPDASRIAPTDARRSKRWLENGGLLVRFAGPRLANDADDFVPVRLRPGSRTLGSALAWETPLGIGAFPADSPLRRHYAASRRQCAPASAWRSPLRSKKRACGRRCRTIRRWSPRSRAGTGLIVLFHVSAGPDWSDLPLSGLFVEMLRRTLAFAARAKAPANAKSPAGRTPRQRLLDGYGALAPAPPDAATDRAGSLRDGAALAGHAAWLV